MPKSPSGPSFYTIPQLRRSFEVRAESRIARFKRMITRANKAHFDKVNSIMELMCDEMLALTPLAEDAVETHHAPRSPTLEPAIVVEEEESE